MSYWNKEYTDGFFNVSRENGFLPIKEPLKVLPNEYNELQHLIDKLHVFQKEGDKGVLGISDEIVVQVRFIPDYSAIIEKETDIFVLQALYRAYTFVTSGFTLEQAYQEFLQSGNYGIARQMLPKNIAKPLVLVSNKLDVYPWLDYHYSYSLGNYVKKDPDAGLHWKNLDMACKFTGTSDEIGFIMVHVYINEVTPDLVGSVMDYGSSKDVNVKSLRICGAVMQEMNRRRRDMWSASRHEHYNDFRIFIMGIKGNSNIFGDGLVYDGCFNNEPQQYRGQTGAQDSIIPMIDIFSGIVDYYPDNKLTEYLLDLRTYRPKCIQNFFVDLRNHYNANPLFKQLTDAKCYEGLVYLLKIVDEVYLFRNGHWQFVQKYIMSNTKYAFATGGTPITTWLINQIEAVLEYEHVIIEYLQVNSNDALKENELWLSLQGSFNKKMDLLMEQVNELKKIDYNIDLVYMKNRELALEDSKL